MWRPGGRLRDVVAVQPLWRRLACSSISAAVAAAAEEAAGLSGGSVGGSEAHAVGELQELPGGVAGARREGSRRSPCLTMVYLAERRKQVGTDGLMLFCRVARSVVLRLCLCISDAPISAVHVWMCRTCV